MSNPMSLFQGLCAVSATCIAVLFSLTARKSLIQNETPDKRTLLINSDGCPSYQLRWLSNRLLVVTAPMVYRAFFLEEIVHEDLILAHSLIIEDFKEVIGRVSTSEFPS